MLKALLYMSMVSVGPNNFAGTQKYRLGKYLHVFYLSERNLTASNFLLTVPFKWHEFQQVHFTMVYSNYIS